MKKQAIALSIYSLCLLGGGIAGYLVAHSLASLCISLAAAFAILTASFFVYKGKNAAYWISIALLSGLLLLFTYRFIKTGKMVPAALWSVTLIFLSFLLASKSDSKGDICA